MDETLSNFCGSPFWETNLTWSTESPRFTPCFEKTVLVWIPCLFLWLFSSIDLYTVFSSKAKNIPWNWRNRAQLLILNSMIVLCLFELFFNISRLSEVSAVDIFTPIIKIVSLALCSTLVILHRKHGQRSSGLKFIFWFLLVLLGFPHFYSAIIEQLSSGGTVPVCIYILYYCLAVIIFMFQWDTDLAPEQTEYPPIKKPSPEESASFPSRMTFNWITYLLYWGFKRTLVSDDLLSIKYQNTTSQVFPLFDKHWNAAINKKNGSNMGNVAKFLKNDQSVDLPESVKGTYKSCSIITPLWKAFGSSFMACSIFKLMQVLLAFISPELLKLLINFIDNDDEPKWHGYLYASAIFASASLQMLFMSQFVYAAMITGLQVRTALMSAIYRKAMKLSNSSRKESTVGEIVNLMAVDAQRFYMLVTSLNNLWSIPIQIILAIVFLWLGLGPSVLAGLAILVVVIPINGYLVNRAKGLQIKQMKFKDERIKMMNEILSGMKVLKLYAWETSFEERVLKIRQKEADLLKKTAYLKAFIAFLWTCTPFLVSLVTFATYVLIDDSHVLDTSKAFVSLALFNILRPPLVLLPMVISNIIQAQVSVTRINKFLNSEELDSSIVEHNDKDDADNSLVIENGTFSWDTSEEPILRNLNLRVKAGSLVALVGTVGSGKSSMISAFLGEMYKVSGKVYTKGSIAYVSQLAWIQNCTLQDNILFRKPLDDKRYHKVIEACALKQDLDVLPAGDQTEIGERGINLSGGQKQRVSLARAVYSDSDIYFLDDPLSAVDSHVGKHIFDEVISSNGILQKKTRILATHSITFLPEVDLIVVLKDSSISEVGTYHQLLDKKGDFSEFLMAHLQEVGNEELEDINIKIGENILNKDQELGNQINTQKSVSSGSSSTLILNNSKPAEVKAKLPLNRDKGEKLVKEEKSEVGKVKWAVYSNYIQAIGSIMFFATIICTTFRQAFSLSSNFWLSDWASDKNIIVNGTQDTSKRNMYLGVYGLLGTGETLSAFLSSIFWFIGAANAGISLHFRLLINIMRYPISFFDTTPQGRIISRLARDIDVLDNIIPSSAKQLLTCLFAEIGTIFVITYSTPVFMLVVIPIGFLYYLIQRFYVATSQQLKRLESVSRSPVYSHFSESISGSSVIRAYNAQGRFIKESEDKVDANQACTYTSIIANRWLVIRLQMLGNLIVFFSALLSVISKDSLSAGIVALSVTYALQITQSLTQLANTSAEVETSIVAVERIKEYSELPQEAAWEVTPNPVGTDWPQKGKVEFINYSVRYREGLDLVLKDINLIINGGEKVGIVGRTGAGKSSVTLGLFRLIEPAGGQVLIDGVDVSKLGLHVLRSHLSIIPQDPVLFSGSLRMNLDPFGSYSDDQVWRALELVHLKPFIKGLPAGLQHAMSEGGGNISVGQRQLICLARVLLHKTMILVLDEATASIDLETDDLIQKTIRTEFADCTVLTIAHRINTIMDSDRVLVFDQGSIVEYDAPSVLLKNKSSAFYGMAHDAGVV